MTGKLAFGIIRYQFLKYGNSLILFPEHGKCAAFFVKSIVEILGVGVSTHQVVECGYFALIVALQSHYECFLISSVVCCRGIDGGGLGIKFFGFGKITVIIVAIANAVVGISIFGLVFIGFNQSSKGFGNWR